MAAYDVIDLIFALHEKRVENSNEISILTHQLCISVRHPAKAWQSDHIMTHFLTKIASPREMFLFALRTTKNRYCREKLPIFSSYFLGKYALSWYKALNFKLEMKILLKVARLLV